MVAYTLEGLLQDPQVQTRLIEYLATHGGSSSVAVLRYVFTGVPFRVVEGRPHPRGGKPIPFAMAKDYFRAKSDVFLLAGANDVALIRTAAANIHVTGKRVDERPRRQSDANHQHHCQLCNASFPNLQSLLSHMSGAAHRVKHAASLLREAGALNTDREGVEVSYQMPIAGLHVGDQHNAIITATNTNQHSITLLRFSLLRQTAGVSVVSQAGQPGGTIATTVLAPRGTRNFIVTFQPKAVGILLDVLVLEFEGFSILRELTAECEPDLGQNVPSIAPVAPFCPKKHTKFVKPADNYEEGQPPPRSRHAWKNPPGNTRVPAWLENMVADGRMPSVEAAIQGQPNTMQGFVEKLQQLLWVEEMQHEVDIRQYDMEEVTMEATRGGLLILKVPGLAENRPSVMRGDALYVKPRAAAPGSREYQGFVHMVQREEVLLKFSDNFHTKVYVTGMKFNVRFSISRSTFVFMQAALNQALTNAVHPATLLGKAGLPVGTGLRTATALHREPTWTTVNPINDEQKTAVRSIFGPPGTGKTMTLTEAAVQLVRMEPSSKLLLTAPSNMAADQLMLRMMTRGVAPSTMYRVCAYSRPKDDLHHRLLDNSNWHDGEGAFVLDDFVLKRINVSRVVVSTCLMAAKLHALGVAQGHFTHIMIDEAGHAEEPLSMAAIAGLIANNNSARLILAGDPKQLGPVILSPLAQRLGLATSAMERLIAVEPYARRDNNPRQPWNTTYITKLVNNYRSHPDLLTLPNKLFYDNELLAMAHRDQTHSLLGFNKLPNANFPFIFHAVVGKDEREASSPSWFNQMEAKLIMEYVIALQDMRANKPTADDIGVISPYRKQVQKIRQLLAARYGNTIKVGSVEEFQGQERRVILISTVRSSAEHLEFDAKYRLGFLKNHKRFNVAVTRAKALLIVVGNPDVLHKDPNWLQFLVHCHRHGACTGSPMPQAVAQQANVSQAAAAHAAGTSHVGNRGFMSALDDVASRLLELTLSSQQAGSQQPEDGFMYAPPMQVEGGEMSRRE